MRRSLLQQADRQATCVPSVWSDARISIYPPSVDLDRFASALPRAALSATKYGALTTPNGRLARSLEGSAYGQGSQMLAAIRSNSRNAHLKGSLARLRRPGRP